MQNYSQAVFTRVRVARTSPRNEESQVFAQPFARGFFDDDKFPLSVAFDYGGGIGPTGANDVFGCGGAGGRSGGGHLRFGRFALDHVNQSGWLAEYPRREIAQFLVVSGSERGGRRHLQYVFRFSAAPQQQPAKEQRDLGGERSSVQVRFVEDDGSQRGAEEHGVLRPAQHVLQHGVVGAEYVRHGPGVLLGIPAAPVFESPSVLARAHSARFPLRHAFSIRPVFAFRRFAGEVEQGHEVLAFQPLVETVHLVVDQRVHGVEDDALDAALVFGRIAVEVVQYRQQERLGLSGASSCGHDDGGAFSAVFADSGTRPFHCLVLVRVQLAVARHGRRGVQDIAQARIEFLRVDQVV